MIERSNAQLSFRNGYAHRLAPGAFVAALAHPAQPVGCHLAGLSGGVFLQFRRFAAVAKASGND